MARDPPLQPPSSNNSFNHQNRPENRERSSREKDDPMATVDDGTLVFYPAFCFKASPTHFSWVKMAAADVHRLERRPGFGGQNIFFYLNHPIRFVCLVGLIVARTDVYKRTILTLDDSSGATIDIVVLKADPNHQNPGQQDHPKGDDEEAQEVRTTVKRPPPQHQQHQPEEELHLTTTTQATLDISPLTPGTVVKLKGTLSSFRARMQLHLERFFPIPDTNAEIRFLGQRIRFLVEVLSVPWVLSEEEIAGLHREAEHEEERVEEEQERERRRQRKRVEREERDQMRIQRMWEREERARETDAVSCQDAGRRVMWELERKRRRREGS